MVNLWKPGKPNKPGQLSPHFKRSNLACKCGCGFDTVDAELISVLEYLRYALKNTPIIILSGCRCAKHNFDVDVDGSVGSLHMKGKAADIKVVGIDADIVADTLLDLFPGQYGIGRYDRWTHIDVRSGRPGRWDKRS